MGAVCSNAGLRPVRIPADCTELSPMINYLDTKICEIEDKQFRSLIEELCLGIGYLQEEFVSEPLRYMLMVIVKEKRSLATSCFPLPGVLTTRVSKLAPDSVVHAVCRDLTYAAKTSIELFDNKTVLSLIRNTYKATCPPLPRQKAPKKFQRKYQAEIDLINRRRKNGSL